MVSTRGVRQRFIEGEKVLCYEPDPTKAKVLYDSKVLGVEESRDRRGRKLVQYKIHFQGWNSSWDRRVNADYVLKDTEENRQLQRELAQKAQLQLAAYLYRKERKKRVRKENTSDTSPKSRNRVSSEDGSSCSTFEKMDSEFPVRDDCDTESYSSSESLPDEERIRLNIGGKLKQYIDFDYEMVKKFRRQHILPARIPAVTILENFVKQSIIKMVTCSPQTDIPRRRGSQLRPERREKEFEKIENRFSLLKEVADGLRIYLNFILTDHLLYNEERGQAAYLLSEENLKNFSYVASDRLSFEYLQTKFEEAGTPPSSETTDTLPHHTPHSETTSQDDCRRRLRSCRAEESDTSFDVGHCKPETCLSSVASTSSGGSTPHTNVMSANLASMHTLHSGIPVRAKDFLQEVISWQLLPSNAAPEASMIFGPVHLARLLVKLPEFLNASNMTDQRLEVLAQHLDSFLRYIESHKDWFGDQNYYKESEVDQKSPQSAPTGES